MNSPDSAIAALFVLKFVKVFDNSILVVVLPVPFVHVLVVATPLSRPGMPDALFVPDVVSFPNITFTSFAAVPVVPIPITSHAFVNTPVHAPVLRYSPLPAFV